MLYDVCKSAHHASVALNLASVLYLYSSYISVLSIFMLIIFHYTAKGKTLCPVNEGPVNWLLVDTTFHFILEIYCSITCPLLVWLELLYLLCLPEKTGINC